MIPDFMLKKSERETMAWLKKMMVMMDSMNKQGWWLCVCVCVCVFESLPVTEGGSKRVHCTLSQ